MSEQLKSRAVGVILTGLLGVSALGLYGCEKPKNEPTPSASPRRPDAHCNDLPALQRVEGGFLVKSCDVELYDPKDPYNQRANPNGVTSDQLVEDIPAGQVFGVTCVQLEGKPTQAIIPTHDSQTGKSLLGAVNLTPESSRFLQQEDVPPCTPAMLG